MSISTEPVSIRRTALLSACGPVGAPHGWLALHGLNQRAARFARPFDAAGGPRRVVLPEGPSRVILDPRTDKTGACWTTVPDRTADMADALPWLDAATARLDAQAGAGKRVLLGFSQGAIIAARFAVARPRVWDAIVLWGMGVPADVDPEALVARCASGRLHLVVGDTDPLATPARVAAVEQRLRSLDVPFERIGYPGGHVVTAEVVAQVAARLSA